jgi:hypothetical protein
MANRIGTQLLGPRLNKGDSGEVTVDTPIAAYNDMQQRFKLPVTLMGGTQAMRLAAQEYLPQMSRETNERYRDRLNSTVLYDAFKHTVDSMAGRPFGQPVQLGAGATPFYEDFIQDVDLAGTDLTSFGRELLSDMLVYGKCHFLVEYPNTYRLQSALGRALTVADERDLGIRSYFVRVSPDQVIGWRGDRVGGRERLEQVRIRFSVIEPSASSAWDETEKNFVAVFTPEFIEVWEQTDNEDEWRMVDEPYPNTLGEIPLVTVYANRQALLKAYPPLEGLGYLNAKHWQQQSDQDQIEKVARVPMLFFKGFADEDIAAVEVGPYKLFGNRNSESDIKMVETSGDAVRVGRESLKDLVEQMESMAMQPLQRTPGNPTATQIAVDAAQNVSDLESYVMLLERGLGQGLAFAAAWQGLPAEEPEVKINQDFGFTFGAEKELAEIREDYKMGAIDQQTYLWERKRRGLYSEEMDISEVMENIENDATASLDADTVSIDDLPG